MYQPPRKSYRQFERPCRMHVLTDMETSLEGRECFANLGYHFEGMQHVGQQCLGTATDDGGGSSCNRGRLD